MGRPQNGRLQSGEKERCGESRGIESRNMERASSSNYTYIVRCCDGTLYTGWTNHLEERIRTHNAGRGAKYTRSRRPVELVYRECFETKEEAMRREAAIKRMTRGQKEALICQTKKREEPKPLPS